MPATLPKQATHPSLYDRMKAVGLKPGLPRPAVPSNTPVYSSFAVAALGCSHSGTLLLRNVEPKLSPIRGHRDVSVAELRLPTHVETEQGRGQDERADPSNE